MPETKRPDTGGEEQRLEKALQRRERYIARYGLAQMVQGGNATLGRALLSAVFRRKLWILLILLAVFACMCVINYAMYDEPAASRLSFNYDKSALGQTPNGTRLDMNDMTGAEVMNRAIALAGLEGKITAAELANCITVTPANVKSYNYISTSYNINLQATDLLGDVEPSSMLNLITRAYKELFFEHYGSNTAVLEEAIVYDEQIEYHDLAELFRVKARQIDQYLLMRINEGGAFYTDESGLSFSALRRLVANLLDYEIANFTAYVGERGVARDPGLYRITLENQNNGLTRQYNTQMYGYTLRKAMIAKYDEVMSAIVLIPTYNSDGEFYMSRTKVGTDYLAEQADAYIAQAKEIKTAIDTNDDLLEKLRMTVNPVDIAVAEAMADGIRAQLESVARTTLALDRRYTLQQTKNYVSFIDVQAPVVNRMNLTRVALVCALMLTILLLGYAARCQYVLKMRVG